MLRLLHFADLHLGVESYGYPDPASGLNTRLLDFQSLEDNMVTIRDRDKMEQIRVPLPELVPTLTKKLAGEPLFVLPEGGKIWLKAEGGK